MGQRLNLEIHDNDEVLANAYYHWSGYTGSAALLTTEVLKHINSPECSGLSPKKKAVWLLYKTGASIAPDEAACLTEVELEEYDFAVNNNADRSEGLIAVTLDEIERTRNWEEARVSIDMSQRTIRFAVIYEYPVEDYLAEYEDTMDSVSKMPVMDINSDMEFTFSEWPEFYNRLVALIKQREYQVKTSDEETIFCFIE